MVAKAFIPDGYSQDAFIEALPNVYEAVRIVFRPVMPEAVRALMHGYFEKPANVQGQIVDETLLRQIVKWDLTDHDGNPVTLSVESYRRIKKPLKDRLFNIVTCYEGGDSDGTTSTSSDKTEIDFDDLLSGTSSGEKSQTEEDAKN